MAAVFRSDWNGIRRADRGATYNAHSYTCLMTPARIIAGLLSLVLVGLLGRSIVRGVGDIRTQILLGVGVVLGIAYVVYGRLPDWLISLSGGSLVADDDPSNISPRVYLPIIGGVILLAVVVFVIVVFLI